MFKGFFKTISKSIYYYLKGRRAIAKFQDVEERRKICYSCDYLRGSSKKTLMCDSCGCLISLKIMFITSECPENKWPLIK
tara:strand:+ start:1686 stop:1925 length:240 start_codon:yes stop_codon:yes gene_type:complete